MFSKKFRGDGVVKERKGIILPFILIIFLVFTIITFSLVFLSGNQLSSMKEVEYETRAHYIAYSGIEIVKNIIEDIDDNQIIYGNLTKESSDSFTKIPADFGEDFCCMRECLEASECTLMEDNNLIIGIYKINDCNYKVLSCGHCGEHSKVIALNYITPTSVINFPNEITNIFDHVLFGDSMLEMGKNTGSSGKIDIEGPIGTNATDTLGIIDLADHIVDGSGVTVGDGGDPSVVIDSETSVEDMDINYESKDFETICASYASFFNLIDYGFDDTLTSEELANTCKNGYIQNLSGTINTTDVSTFVRFIEVENLSGDLTIEGSGLVICKVTGQIGDHNFNIGGNSENLLVYYDGTSDITFQSGGFHGMIISINDFTITFNSNSNNGFNGLFFLPNADVEMQSANADFPFGAIIADTIIADANNTEIIYDADLVEAFFLRFNDMYSSGDVGSGSEDPNNQIEYLGTYLVWSR